MSDDATTQASESSEAPVTETSPEPESTPTAEQTASKQIDDYRKRQAGAEAARQGAEKKLAEQTKELEAYRAASRSADDAKLATEAGLQERIAQLTKERDEAATKAEARILDAKFPNARAELPEVTDEVRLAKFEAMLAEPAETPAPTTLGANPPRTPTNQTEDTSHDIAQRLKAMTPPWINT